MRFEFDAFAFDEARYELRLRDVRVELDAKALDLLGYLIRRPGQLVRKEELFEAVWPDSSVADNALAVAVSKLRKAFLAAPPTARPSVENVYGRGYRLLCSNVRASSASLPAAPALVHDQAGSKPALDEASAEGPLVGRAETLLRLQRAQDQARGGRGNVVLITGEPGIGKTRLADAFLARQAAALCAWGQFRPFGSIRPLAGWLSLLKECARLCAPPQRASLLATIERCEAGSAEESALPTVIDALSRALLALARVEATVIVLDDVQWADSASLQLLAGLVAEIARTPLLVLITLRSGEPPAGDRRKLLDYVAGHRNVQRIPLRPLSTGDVGRYVVALFGHATPELKQAVFEKSEGHPFFMVHVLRPHRGGPAPSLASIALAGEALEIVRQRLEALAEPDRELLRTAAVLGRRVDLRLLGQLTGRDPLETQDALHAACAVGLLRTHPAVPGELEFDHEVIVTVLGEQVSADQQARIHLAAALAVTQRAQPDAPADSLETLLHRLAASPHGEVRGAIQEARRAARDAALYAAHGDACALLLRALQALALSHIEDGRLASELWVELAFSARVSGHPAREEYLTRALALAESHGFADLLARLGMQMSPAPGALVERDAGRVLATAAQSLTDGKPALLARVLAHQSWTPPFSFDRGAVERLTSRSLALAESGQDSEALRAALSAQAYFAGAQTEHTRALFERIEALTTRAPSAERSFWRSRISFSGMVLALQQGDLAAFTRAHAAYGVAATTPRSPELLWHHERARTIDRMNRGDYSTASQELAALADKAHQLQLEVGVTICSADQFHCLRETVGVPAGLSGAVALAQTDADSPCVRARKLRAMAELAHPGASKALAAFSTDLIVSLPSDRDCVATLAHLAVASVAAGARLHQQLLYRLLMPHRQRFVADLSLHAEGSVEHFLGLLATALGRPRDAELHFERAAAANAHAGLRARALHTQLGLAELLRANAPERTRQLAGELAERAVTLGLRPLALRAAELQHV